MQYSHAQQPRHRISFLTAVLLLALLAIPPCSAEKTTYVAPGAVWKYLQGTQEASLPDISTWTTPEFDDSSWDWGSAPYGYDADGDYGPFGTDLSLLTPPMRSNYSSLYLRTTFQVPVPNAVTGLQVEVNYDDAVVVWINGTQVARINAEGSLGDPVPVDSIMRPCHTAASWENFELIDPAGYLVPGENILAVQIVQCSITSSDLMFDLELFDPYGPDLLPPTVSSIRPVPGLTLRNLDQLEIFFNEGVLGVDASDLLINNSPASTVSGSGTGPYLFRFPTVPTGTTEIRWIDAPGITDDAVTPNTFEPGPPWQFVIDPTVPPANVTISEFLASNGHSTLDEDGDTEDWIEIWNRGDDPVQLSGWSLTDDPQNPDRWTFPSKVLGSGDYLIVFASAKDRSPTNGSPLHTNFKLDLSGEYLALFAPDDLEHPVCQFNPEFPQQRTDYSYGLSATGQYTYLAVPTPESPNTTSPTASGFCGAPLFSQQRGFFSTPFDLTLTPPTPGSSIYYTLDGSEPTKTGAIKYSSPIRIAGTNARAAVTVRAIAALDGMLPSLPITQTFVFPDYVLSQPNQPAGFPTNWKGFPTDYGMDPLILNTTAARALAVEGLGSLPVVSIVTHTDHLFSASSGIYANSNNSGPAWERPVSAELFFPEEPEEGFQIDCGLRIQGGSSVIDFKSIKLSMRMLFKDDYGNSKLKYQLYPDSPVDEFDTLVLDAGLNLTWTHPSHSQRVHSQYVRDQFVADLENAMGQPAPHGRFVHVFLNGLYWGMYDLHEKPDHSFSAEYFGGAKEEYDAFKHRNSSGDLLNGDTIAWETARSIAAGDLSNYSRYLELQQYVDVVNLADYMLANLWAGNTDWAHQNWYASRRRTPDGRFRFYSWDAEHTLKSLGDNRVGVNNSWSPAEFYDQLRNKSAEWRLLFADRVHKHFFNGGILYVDSAHPQWDPDQPLRNMPAALYMQRIDEIFTAIQCESARWGDAEINTSPNIRYTRNEHWIDELNWVLDSYLPYRSPTVLNQLKAAGLYPAVEAPILSTQGGPVEIGTQVRFQRALEPNAIIYYTLDGTDPRVWGAGTVAPSAITSSGSVTISDRTLLKSRVLSNGTWSALNEALFTVPQNLADLHIVEIMFNPSDGRGYEFVELLNSGPVTLDLEGITLDGGIQFAFAPGAVLPPGERLVLVNDADTFALRYPGVQIHGAFDGNLANDGESISILAPGSIPLEQVLFDDGDFWPLGPDGFGFSLVRRDLTTDPESAFAWIAGPQINGTPGAPETNAPVPPVYFNEVLARVDGALVKAVELVNLNPDPVDIGGWYLSDASDTTESLKKFPIPAGTTLQPDGILTLFQPDFAPSGLTLKDEGGKLFLSSFNPAGQITGMIAGIDYESTDPNRSFGLHQASHELQYVPLTTPTLAAGNTSAQNAPPFVGDVVISEIMYQPPVDGLEYVELYNQSAAEISLFSQTAGTGWRLNGVQQPETYTGFLFGPADSIPAHSSALVVGVEPNLFRSQYAIPSHIPIFGPFAGGIDNSGERLKLSRPELFNITEPVVAYITQDQVRYNDKAPWPTEPDGLGASLERRVLWTHADEPQNWAARDGGSPGEVPVTVVQIDIAPNQSGQPFTIQWAGASATEYQVQWSQDLITWTDATTPPAEVETGLFSWTDPEETTDMRFYRVIHP